MFGWRFGTDGTCSLLDDLVLTLYLWYVLTCCSSVYVNFWEVRDEAIEIYLHQCSPNFKATIIVNTDDLS